MKYWKSKPGEVIKILPTARQVGKNTNFATVKEWEKYVNIHVTMNRPAVRKNSKKIFELMRSLEKIKKVL